MNHTASVSSNTNIGSHVIQVIPLAQLSASPNRPARCTGRITTGNPDPTTSIQANARGSPAETDQRELDNGEVPKALTVVMRDLKSSISGTENVVFTVSRPGAL